MHHSQCAVFQQMHVQLRAEAMLHGAAECRHRIFGDLRLVVVAAVRVAEALQLPHGLLARPRGQQQKIHAEKRQYNQQ